MNDPTATGELGITLLQLASPLAVNGSTSGFRRPLRTTMDLGSSDVRCYGYGNTNATPGVSTQLTGYKPYTGSTSGIFYPNTYALDMNGSLQRTAPGDTGGGCLDDVGALIGVQIGDASLSWLPATRTFATAASTYYPWVNAILAGQCTAGSDCASGYCNLAAKVCAATHCQDGVKDADETGLDCGGSCTACVITPPPRCVPSSCASHACCNNACLKPGTQCQ